MIKAGEHTVQMDPLTEEKVDMKIVCGLGLCLEVPYNVPLTVSVTFL